MVVFAGDYLLFNVDIKKVWEIDTHWCHHSATFPVNTFIDLLVCTYQQLAAIEISSHGYAIQQYRTGKDDQSCYSFHVTNLQ
jgi:hypothetical protein